MDLCGVLIAYIAIKYIAKFSHVDVKLCAHNVTHEYSQFRFTF